MTFNTKSAPTVGDKQIHVIFKDLGFWTQEPVTITRYENDNLIWCNHAAATAEKWETTIHRIDQPDITYYVSVLVCDKCGAFKNYNSDYWEGAPLEGVTEGA